MLVNNLRLAWHFARQEKHYAHQRFLRWTQAILMIFIVCLSQTSQSIQDYLTDNLQNLLGADLVISQQSPLTDPQYAQLTEMSEQIVLTQSLTTTFTHHGNWQPAKLKAVGADYPLQGELRTSTSLDGSSLSTSTGPSRGEIWLDARLLASLSLQVGESLTLAEHSFKVSRILQHEPDRLMEGHSVDMRAMLNVADFSKLNFPPDLLHHRYLFAVDPQQVADILAWQKTNLPAAQVNHKQGSHPLALFWKRTENVIGLASIILFFMAAIAIEQLSRVQMRKEQYFSAICMSLGTTRMTGFQISVFKWLLHLVLMIPLVLLVSAGFHWLLIDWLTATFSGLSWQWNMPLAVKSVLAISLIFLVFQAPVWLGIKYSTIGQLVNREERKASYWITSASALLVLSAVAFAYSDNGLLTIMLLSSMAICVMLIIVTSWVALSTGEKLTQNLSGLAPFALFMMKQRLVSKSTQILGVGLCSFLLLFTLMLLKDIGDTMENYSRQHDGNMFVSRATQQQMQDIDAWASHHSIEIRQRKPYMQAKLTKVNGQYLADFSQKPSESMATFKRSIRLHWSEAVPSNNRLVNGRWWQADDADWQQVSIEQEVMTDLGLNIGDRLTFYVGEQYIDFTIVASHAYRPGAGSITFWVQMPPTALAHIPAPHYSMASLELTDAQFPLLGNLWQQHPSLRMVSLKELTTRFDTTLAMVTQVISGFSMLIVVLAIIVILSSIHGMGAREKKKNSIIMSFGFTRKTCLKLNIIEWIVTGSVAALGAIVSTYIAGLLIYQSQFSMSYQPDFVWLSGTLMVILSLVTALGVYASRNSLTSSIRELMSE